MASGDHIIFYCLCNPIYLSVKETLSYKCKSNFCISMDGDEQLINLHSMLKDLKLFGTRKRRLVFRNL